MTNILLRAGLTLAALASIAVDCHNATAEANDNELHFVFDVFKTGMLLFIWLI